MKMIFKTFPIFLLGLISAVSAQEFQLREVDSLGTFVDYVAGHSSTRKLADSPQTIDIFDFLAEGELRLVRNAVFAREGYTFQDTTLYSFFERYAWYKPRDGKLQLNEIDQLNIKMIQSKEEEQRKRFLKFLANFDTRKLPFKITKENRLSPPNGSETIDEKTVNLFLEQQGRLSTRTKARPPGSGQYYPWFKIERPVFTVFCFLVEYPAGGYLDSYFLVVLDKRGVIISKERIAVYAADASFEHYSKTEITSGLKIICENVRIENNDLEEEISREISYERFWISNVGNIEKSSTKAGS